MEEIFYLQRHGGGAFTWSDCYNMPTQFRKFNVAKLSSEISEENKKADEAKKGTNNLSMDKMATGDVKGFSKQPDYIAKAPRK